MKCWFYFAAVVEEIGFALSLFYLIQIINGSHGACLDADTVCVSDQIIFNDISIRVKICSIAWRKHFAERSRYTQFLAKNEICTDTSSIDLLHEILWLHV